MERNRSLKITPIPAGAISRYIDYSRADWSALRANTPLLLSEAELSALRGINVADISSDTVVLVHDTKRPTEPPKVFTPHEWAAFIIGVKVGDFDKHVDQTALKEVEGAYANTH